MLACTLYGIGAPDLFAAKSVVEKTLNCRFVEHESLFQGGTYYLYKSDGGDHLRVRENRDPFEDGPEEEGFPAEKFLLYVDDTSRWKALQTALSAHADIIHPLKWEEV